MMFYKLLWVVQSSVGCIRPCRPLARVRYMDVESQTALSVYMTKREKEENKGEDGLQNSGSDLRDVV